MSRRLVFVVALLLLGGGASMLAQTAPGNTVGTTAGKLAVGNSGGASYSIPIALSPGTAGVQPKLSFEYSSRGGNGIMGVGWSVSGLSAITRTPPTLAQDTIIRGVNFTADDRFAMDGQRLIAIAGADGGAGTEYRTEIESFTKVISQGPSGSGPASFTAYTKSGLTYTYGETPSSRFLAQGRTDGTVLSWPLSKIADRNGNYVLFNYTLDQTNGEYLVSSIEYTRNDARALSAYAFVNFEYEDRPDPAVGYLVGSKTSLRKRLKSLTTSVTGSTGAAQVVRKYSLEYEVSPSTGKSRLRQIQESAGSLSFNPTTFAWSADGDAMVRSAYRGEHIYNGSDYDRWLEGDFNGDGRSDFARVSESSGTPLLDVTVTKVTPPGAPTEFEEARWATGPANGYNRSDQWLAGDYDGDGRLDILRSYDAGGTQHLSALDLYKNQGNGFVKTTCSVTGGLGYKDYAIVYPADMNGDGRLDLIAISAITPENEGSRIQFAVFLNQGTTGSQTSFSGAIWGLTGGVDNDNLIFDRAPGRWSVGDLTGDGLPELLYIHKRSPGATKWEPQVIAYLNRQGAFVMQEWAKTTDDYDSVIWERGDFNGDGLIDLLHTLKGTGTTSPVTIYLSTGLGFLKQSWGGISRESGSSSDVRVGDFNGDGRSDIGVIVTSSEYFPPPCSGCDPNAVAPAASTDTLGYYEVTYTQRRFLSNGTTGFRDTGASIRYTQQTQNRVGTKRWMPADFNGDGMEDLARLSVFPLSGQERIACDIWTSTTGVHDLLTATTDGMDSTSAIEYKTLAESSVYSKSEPGDTVANAIDLMTPMPVVARVTYDDGRGGQYPIDYQYNGLKADRLRGLLGFAWVKSTDARTGLSSVTTLRQDYPFTGMVLASETPQPDGRLLSLSTTEHLDASPGAKVHLLYSSQNIATSWETNGEMISQTTTDTYAIDSFGNTTDINVRSRDGFAKRTVSVYENDPIAWKLGKLQSSTVTSSAPNQQPVVRKSGFDYTPNGQVKAETIEPDDPALWAVTSYDIGAVGNVRATTTTGPDIVTRTTTTQYDERGRFVRDTINALGQKETRLYDERWGSVTSIKGPNGLETITEYDDLGRVRLSTGPDGSQATTTYAWAAGDPDANGAKYLVRVTADGAPPVTTYFDRLGREVRKVSYSGIGVDNQSRKIFVDKRYNALGQVEAVSRPYFAGEPAYFATTIYDLVGRAKEIQTPKEGGGVAVTTNVYRGLEVDSINPMQQGTALKTTTRKDSQGHLVKVTDAKNGTVEYKYDPAGNLIETKQGANVTKMTYDTRGRKKTMDDPDLGVWNYKYNSLGELVEQTDAKGQTVTMTYDKLGRLKTRSEFEGTSTWVYDTALGKGIGKLHTASFAPADASLAPYKRTLTYDELGRPKDQTERIDAKDYKVTTGYGAFSRPETITYPSGVWVKQIYDANGYVKQIQRENGSAYWTARAYDAAGHITEQRVENGVITDRVYVPETGVLQKIQSGFGGGIGVQDLKYEFDVIGNLTKRTDKKQTVNAVELWESFVYDELNRVVKTTVAGQDPRNFGYDLGGNITSKYGMGSYSYTPAAGSLQQEERAHPHAVRQINGGAHATYDKNGNMTGGFDRTLTWTSFNMPKLIQRPSNGASSRFTYDVDHGRITQVAAKNGTSATTIYVGGIYEEVHDGITLERKHYISSPAGRIAIYASVTQVGGGGPPIGTVTTNTKFLHTDHLGSIDVVTNKAGAVLERDSFNAWGSRRTTDWKAPAAGSAITSIITRGYTGHEQLDDLGLIHMNGRVYDPALGRFLSADPFIQAPTETQNFNRYTYVLNNPLSLTDPSGFNFLNNFGKWLNDNLGSTGTQIVIAAVAVVAGVATAGVFTAAAAGLYGSAAIFATSGGLTLAGSVVSGAGFGFGAGFLSTSLSGASLGEAFQSALIGAVVGGISGGIAHGLGGLNPGGEFGTLGHAGQTAGHALVGGAISEIQGGDFGSGALAAGISAGVAPGINLIGGGSADIEYVAARVSVSAAIGGTAAEISGGRFANGAVTAAFLRLYNEESSFSKREPKGGLDKLAPYKGKYNIRATIDLLRGKVGAEGTLEALESALAQNKFVTADAAWHASLAHTNTPIAHIGGYFIVDDRINVPASHFPKFLAHEGIHRADYLAGRYRGSAFKTFREYDRGWQMQHSVASQLGIFDPIKTRQDIAREYK